jgi:hypothetical protein
MHATDGRAIDDYVAPRDVEFVVPNRDPYSIRLERPGADQTSMTRFTASSMRGGVGRY